MRNKIPAFTLNIKEIDLQLRINKVLDRVEQHTAGSALDCSLSSLTLAGLRGHDIDDVNRAKKFLDESFNDIVIPGFEVDRERCIHEGFIHAIADALVGIENNHFYYVDEPGRKGFAFTINKTHINNANQHVYTSK
eukprot:gene31330-38707_t